VLEVKVLQIRIGARVLMDDVSFRVDKGDKVGLVGRNGAGKTTLTKVIAGDMPATEGSIHHRGEMGYLPQDPRAGDPSETARTRILNARGTGITHGRDGYRCFTDGGSGFCCR
jgi:ATPase subunit of ABC transporter with duplicated ATPase domains